MRVNINSILLTLLFSTIGGSALAMPVVEDTTNTIQNATTAITPSQILKVAPKSTSCDNPPAKGECATADTAARSVTASFERYQVSSLAEQAAVIGLIAFESDEFQYNRNHFPGVEGQGTRNMQSSNYNVMYAQSIIEIRDEVCKANGDVGQILDLLLANEGHDFGSGAWFLTTQCGKDVREQLQSGSEEGWKAYITECVGTDANAKRKGYWRKAVEAL